MSRPFLARGVFVFLLFWRAGEGRAVFFAVGAGGVFMRVYCFCCLGGPDNFSAVWAGWGRGGGGGCCFFAVWAWAFFFLSVWAGGRGVVFAFAVWAGGRVFLFAVWAGALFLCCLLFGRRAC